MSLQTGTLEITGLRVETLAALDAKARELGKTVEEYARELIEEEVAVPEMTIDEALAPFRRQVAESGITDEGLDELFMQARRECYREQKEQK